MKAKHIKKIKAKMQRFLVLRSFGQFGDFMYGREPFGEAVPHEDYEEVMARNPKEAAKRYMKRTHAIRDLNRYDKVPDESNAMFGVLRILPKDKPYLRFVTFWS